MNFSHKYNIENETKDHLIFCGKYFKEIQTNKNFFKKNLKKNIFLCLVKKKLSLYFFSNVIKNNQKHDELIKNMSQIEKISIPEFQLLGEYLLENGIKSGRKMGEAIEEIKNKWLENNFNLDNEQLAKTIKKFK